MTGCFYPSGGHTSKKNKTETATATSSTDPVKKAATSTSDISSRTPLNMTESQPWQLIPITKTKPTDSHTMAVNPTSEENPLYIPGSDSNEIDLEAAMEDEDTDAFQDRMAAKRQSTADDEPTYNSDQNVWQLPHVEAHVFETKHPTSKKPK